jgi:hypothetical protein
MSDFLDFVFGRRVTLEERYSATIDKVRKNARNAERQEDRRKDDAEECRIAAKNAANRGDRNEARDLLKKSAHNRRRARKFAVLGHEANELVDLAQTNSIKTELLQGHKQLAYLARATTPRAPDGESQAAAEQQASARGRDVARLNNHFSVATTAFKTNVGEESDEEDDALEPEDETWINDTLEEFEREKRARVPRERARAPAKAESRDDPLLARLQALAESKE